MIKLCIITQCNLPVPAVKGGAVETLVEYILNCNELKKQFDITVLSTSDAEVEEESKKYKYTQFKYFAKYAKKYNSRLKFVFRVLKKIGIYISPSFEYRDINKYIKSNVNNFDYFIFEGGPTTQLCILNKYIPKEKLLMHLHWDGLGNHRMDESFSYLLAISKYIGNCWQRGTGCSEQKIKLLPNCVEVGKFEKQISLDERNELKRSLQINSQDRIIIFVGRIVKEKGVLELIEAFAKMKQANVKLLLIGSANFGNKTSTPYEEEVSHKVEEYAPDIIRVGYVHHSNLYKYYSISDLAVMPSLFQEPAGLVALETLATGTPLIATRVGGIPEYVNEKCAVLVEKDENLVDNLAHEMNSLLSDNERKNSMSIEAKKFVMDFDVNNYYENFVQIMESIRKEG